jgi:DNA polymerase elongation subunit (family B)
MKIIVDIETVSEGFENLSESQKEFILRYAEKEADEKRREQMKDEAIRYLSLYPFTAKVISIGMLNVDSGKSLILYEGNEEEWESEENESKYRSSSESEMLNTFWEYLKKINQVITFNGRSFDIPFLNLRSALFRIKPTKNLLGSRYKTSKHIDLLE